MEEADKLKRIVEARMKLKARFEEKIKQNTDRFKTTFFVT